MGERSWERKGESTPGIRLSRLLVVWGFNDGTVFMEVKTHKDERVELSWSC